MRVVLQRVLSAEVRVASATVSCLSEMPVYGKIGKGILALVGFVSEDTTEDLEWMARKILAMRIFDDECGVMNRSLSDISGEIMIVSQFTLLASTRKGNRPSYIRAAHSEKSAPLYEKFLEMVSFMSGRMPARGVFGADMKVLLVNDGPVTIIMDSKEKDF